MRTSIITAILFFAMTSLFAQKDNCDFVPTKERYNYLKRANTNSAKLFRVLKQVEPNKLRFVNTFERLPNGNFSPIINLNVKFKFIPIVAHILRQDNGLGGLTELALKDAVAEANKRFVSTGFKFRVCEIKYIDDDALFNTNYDDDITGAPKSYDVLDVVNRNVKRKINIYFYPTGRTSWAYGVLNTTTKQHLMMHNNHVGNTVTLAHELAHWFDLIHTHGKSSTADELVNGSNCTIAGDLLCDTPADPNLSASASISPRVNTNCQYIPDATLVDANGDQYTPDPSNLMSYATRSCRVGFTSQQDCRMISAYFTMKADRGYTLKVCSLIASN